MIALTRQQSGPLVQAIRKVMRQRHRLLQLTVGRQLTRPWWR